MKPYKEVKNDIKNRCRVEVVKTQLNYMLSLFLYFVETHVEQDDEVMARIDSYMEDFYHFMLNFENETKDLENHCDNYPCDKSNPGSVPSQEEENGRCR